MLSRRSTALFIPLTESGHDTCALTPHSLSDQSAVKVGRHGVSALLKQMVPWVIANYCVAHHLTLGSRQTADEIPFIKKFKAILGQLYITLVYVRLVLNKFKKC